MTSLRRKVLPEALTFEAEPFQGYTEFDEVEGVDSEDSQELSEERRKVAGVRRAARFQGRPQSRPRKRRPARPFFPTFRMPFDIFSDAQATGAPDDAAAFDAANDDGADFAPDADQSQYDEWEWLDPEASEFEVSFEWMGEVSRSSREYIRWVQQSLNQILGLRLAEDGDSGPQTRSALRRFQTQAQITVDGDVGPQTEGALIKAGALPPPGSTTVGDGGVKPATPPSSPAPQTGAAQGINTRVYFGLDTYSGDGTKNPDWVRARNEGSLSFAIIKASQGGWSDPMFKREWPRIKDAGIVRGAYMFLNLPSVNRPNREDPVAQARKFIETVGRLDESDLPPTLDVEFPGGRAKTRATAQQCLADVRAAWHVLADKYGVAPIIYTSARVWHEDLDNLPAPDLIESPLWLTRYFNDTKAVLDPKRFADGKFDPKIPTPWGDATNWWLHQYQGDARQFPGFFQVDMNRFNAMSAGALGDRVKWVQRRLGISQTGNFDAPTDMALRALQQRKGLAANGLIDPQTFAFLCWSNPS